MNATIGRTATGYTIANEKKVDVWGAVRASQSPGSHVVNPNKQYCANLVHMFDGESDLITMHARYYEPATGRFISEDPAQAFFNFYVYADNNPVSLLDFNGEEAHGEGFDPAERLRDEMALLSDGPMSVAKWYSSQSILQKLLTRGIRAVLAFFKDKSWATYLMINKLTSYLLKKGKLITKSVLTGAIKRTLIEGAIAATAAGAIGLFITARHTAWYNELVGER